MYIQKFWRATCFRRIIAAAAAGNLEYAADAIGLHKSNVRLRRVTHSEKHRRAAKAEKEGTVVKSINTIRAEACAQITMFLRDLEKLFRSRLLKFSRLVLKILDDLRCERQRTSCNTKI